MKSGSNFSSGTIEFICWFVTVGSLVKTTLPKTDPMQLTQIDLAGNKQFLTELSPISERVLAVLFTFFIFMSSEGVKNGIFPP